jgi:TetR/AcrR family fatty acid metabolism transcriptional regulator
MAQTSKSNDKHERILQAAIRVFARNGFYNSKVAEIAKEAQVADGTIYLYFKNKDDILIKLFEAKMNDMILALEARLAGVEDPLEKIRIYIHSHFEMVKEHPDLMEVITVELRQSAKFMKDYNNKQFNRYLRILSDMIREGKDKGLIRADIRPGIFKRALFGMMDELSLYLVLAGSNAKYNVDLMSSQVSDFFLRALTCTEKA